MYSEHFASGNDAQHDARRDFQMTVERLIEVMAEENPIKPTASTCGPLGGAALARAGRRVGLDTRERRQLAHMLVAGALLNHNNPVWNPADAATDRASYDDPLITLLLQDVG